MNTPDYTPGTYTEGYLQSNCFRWHESAYPEKRGNLFMVYNNPKNKAHAAVLLGMGLKAGVSDFILLLKGTAVFIEMKLPKKKQSQEQKEFESRVISLGFRYFVIDTQPAFEELIDGLYNGAAQCCESS